MRELARDGNRAPVGSVNTVSVSSGLEIDKKKRERERERKGGSENVLSRRPLHNKVENI